MGRVVGLAILLLVAVLVDGSSSCGKKAAQVALSHSERLFGSRKLFLRGGGGNQGVHPSWTWGSLPRRAYAWMVENWRRIRNVKGGRQGLGTVGTKRSAPMSGESSSSGRTASKRRKEGAEHPEEGGNFSEDPLLRGVKAIHHKGRGGHEKGAREASNFKPSSRFSDMSASDLLRETQGITSAGNCLYIVGKDYVPGMKTTASFYASESLLKLVLIELKSKTENDGAFIPAENENDGAFIPTDNQTIIPTDNQTIRQSIRPSFIPAVEQLANVATLPGIVSSSIGMPDIHSGYGFAIGNVAAMDMDDPQAVVSPGGVGFDINCGVRLLRSNLRVEDIDNVKTKLADTLFETIPTGVGAGGIIRRLSVEELDEVLTSGMKWAEKENLVWEDDRENVEEGGCFEGADADCVSSRAKQRGRTQCGSLGSGNHYAEVQVVDEVFDEKAAGAMGLEKGSICVMLHSGSRGLGHQVCTDALQEMQLAMVEQKIELVDRQLACCRIQSDPGQRYLKAMKCAANFAFVNRSLMAMGVRKAFEKVFGKSAHTLGMSVVYDVSHNIAKEEEHTVAGKKMRVLVHRKGATRAFGPGHPNIPEKYREIGQPVLVGGSMGTCSYVLTGTEGAMQKTFGSTCHGAGRAMSRSEALKTLNSTQVLDDVEASGCTARIATRRLAAEEAPQSYKDVSEVVQTCHSAGISALCVRLKPLICVKG